MSRSTLNTDFAANICAGQRSLKAALNLPDHPRGLIILLDWEAPEGSPSQNRFLCQAFLESDLGVLRVQLDDGEKDTSSESNFDIEILAEHLHYVLSWVEQNPNIRELPLGLCGEGRHAGAALIVGAKEPKKIRAIVARAGRPDLAESYLTSIQVPVLLVVGGYDDMLVHLNEKSHRELRCIKEILILAYASHSFTESGAMEEFADIARSWFNRHLANSEEQSETEIPLISFVDPEI